MAPPVVATLIGLALLKKVVVYSAARAYGIGRCYRKTRRAARWLFKSDVAASKAAQALLGKAFRLPDRLIGHFHQGKPAAQKLAAAGQRPAVPSFASSALWRAHSRFATRREALRLRQEAACQTVLRHGRSAKDTASMHARRLEASLKLMPAFRLQRVLLPPVIV